MKKVSHAAVQEAVVRAKPRKGRVMSKKRLVSPTPDEIASPFSPAELVTLEEYVILKNTVKTLKTSHAESHAENVAQTQVAECESSNVMTENATIEKSPRTKRRRQIDPTTCERDYSTEEVEFMNALDEYKRHSGRMFPTCSEILEVIRNLGYAKE